MKRFCKIICLVIAVILTCALFSGCDKIDDMKSHHGIRTESGDIKVGDTVYKLLPASEYLDFNYFDYDPVYVTEADVPVLLSKTRGDTYEFYGNRLFISGNGTYCRSDKYETIVKQINDGVVLEKYCYVIYDFGNGLTQNRAKEKSVLLKNEKHQAIDSVLKNVEPVLLTDTNELGEGYFATFYACSKDSIFKKEYQIIKNGEKYYIVNYGTLNASSYEVPDTLNGVFEDIVNEIMNNDNELW